MSARILIVYGSNYGQAAKISARLGELFAREGVDVTVLKGDEIAQPLSLDCYDGIIVGASLIGGKFQNYIETFVFKYLNALESVPNAFFAVSGCAASPLPEKRKVALDCIDAFLERTTWRPVMTASFAGAMAYTKYSLMVRWVMKIIARREGVTTDTSCDHELTDWSEVERFARTFLALVQVSPTKVQSAPDSLRKESFVRLWNESAA